MSDEPTTPAADPSEPEPTVERWICGGVRVNTGGTKLTAWFDPHGAELHFKADRGRAPIAGSVYDAKVTRAEEGGVTLHGTPRYVGPCEDEERRAVIIATDRAWRGRIETDRRMKADKADDPLMNMCDQVAAVLRKVPAPQRQMAVYAAIARISEKSWR